MQKILLLLIILSLISCKVSEKPVFKEVKSIHIVDKSLTSFTLQADVLFLNENKVGGTLEAKDIHLFIDNMDVAILTTEPFKVKKESEFTLPIKAVIPFEKVFKSNEKNILNNILNIITNKKIVVKYKGKIRYSLGVFHYDYPLDYESTITLSK